MSNTDKKTILITGASRGLGYELVKQFTDHSWNVLAGLRNYSPASTVTYKNCTPVKLDVNDINDINNLQSILANNSIDVMINNAGIYLLDEFEKNSAEDMIEMYKTHVIAPLVLSKQLFPNIRSGNQKLIVLITGRMGSFANNTGGASYGYRASKAAANMIVKTMAIDLEKHGIKVLAVHPGWIKTAMGAIIGEGAYVDTVESAEGIKNLILNSHEYINGGYYTYQGKKLEW